MQKAGEGKREVRHTESKDKRMIEEKEKEVRDNNGTICRDDL